MASSSLLVAAQPPTVATIEKVLSPPLAVVMRLNPLFPETDFNRFFAVATLMDETGDFVKDGLVGRLAESPRLLPTADLPSFVFGNLAIKSAGRFWIRVTLMRVDGLSNDAGLSSQGVVSIMDVDSQSIVVNNGEIEVEPPAEE